MAESVTQARSRLDQLLKQLADKEESTILNEDVKEQDKLQIGSQPSTPRKRPTSTGSRTPRKRMKRDIVSQDIENQANVRAQRPSLETLDNTYSVIWYYTNRSIFRQIYKLFDHSVDFAKYNENTSLYVLARAWMKNKPHEMETIAESSATSDFIADAERSLPYPVNTGKLCPVIPAHLPQTRTLALKLENPQVDPPRTTDLLCEHMAHWKEVRKSWKEASHKNQRRYMSSIQMIRRLFNQHM